MVITLYVVAGLGLLAIGYATGRRVEERHWREYTDDLLLQMGALLDRIPKPVPTLNSTEVDPNQFEPEPGDQPTRRHREDRTFFS